MLLSCVKCEWDEHKVPVCLHLLNAQRGTHYKECWVNQKPIALKTELKSLHLCLCFRQVNTHTELTVLWYATNTRGMNYCLCGIEDLMVSENKIKLGFLSYSMYREQQWLLSFYLCSASFSFSVSELEPENSSTWKRTEWKSIQCGGKKRKKQYKTKYNTFALTISQKVTWTRLSNSCQLYTDLACVRQIYSDFSWTALNCLQWQTSNAGRLACEDSGTFSS